MDDRNPPALDGEPLPADVAAELAGWATSEPPAGFVDRLIVAAQRTQAGPPPARRWVIGAAIAAATAVAAALLLLLRGEPGAPDEGARVARQRETIVLGRRGVAVAEAGTELTWAISASGAVAVHQTRGDVFYRVERGEPFAVETPYGRVLVTGTCFRVEIADMRISRPPWIGGVVRAAVAATVVIAVYEGQVRVVNARGQADARAGDRIAVSAGAAPTRLGSGTALPGVAAVEPPPPDSATIAELRRRDQSHRGEIALLHARLQALETGAAASPDTPAAAEHRADRRKIFDLSPDELAAMAKDCEIRFDTPGYGVEPHMMTDKLAAANNLSAADRAIYDQTVRKESAQYMAALRALYQELVGGGSEDLDAGALVAEIMQKSPTSDAVAARKQLAEERAGITAPPADTRNRSVIERLFRLESAAGDTLEQMLAAELGPDKAHQIRASGWAGGDSSIMHSCSD